MYISHKFQLIEFNFIDIANFMWNLYKIHVVCEGRIHVIQRKKNN